MCDDGLEPMFVATDKAIRSWHENKQAGERTRSWMNETRTWGVCHITKIWGVRTIVKGRRRGCLGERMVDFWGKPGVLICAAQCVTWS